MANRRHISTLPNRKNYFPTILENLLLIFSGITLWEKSKLFYRWICFTERFPGLLKIIFLILSSLCCQPYGDRLINSKTKNMTSHNSTVASSIIPALAFLVVLISQPSCSSDDDEKKTTATTGSITGSITPIDAAISVSCIKGSGGQTIVIDNPEGDFEFVDLTPGPYTVSVIPKVGYDKPTDKGVNVEADKSVSTGNFNLVSNGEVANVSFNFGGTDLTMSSPYTSCVYTSPNFDLRGETSTSPEYWLIDINLKNVNGSGTYNATASGSFIQVAHFTSPGVTDGNWMTSNGGTGQVIITSMNLPTRVVSGTFTATLVPQGVTGGGNKTVTNGSFTDFNF